MSHYPSAPDIDALARIVGDARPACIRFMNWLGAYWASGLRPPDSAWRYAGGAWAAYTVPLERCVRFANDADTMGWYSLPYTLNRNAIRLAMAYIEKHSKHPYVIEYGNEVWNTASAYRAQRDALGGDEGIVFGRYADIVRMMADSASARATVAVGCQCMRPDVANVMLGGGLAHHPRVAIAIAPYYAPPHRVAVSAESLPAQLYEAAIDDIVRTVSPAIDAHAAIAKRNGVALMAYEMGGHWIGTHPAIGIVESSLYGEALARALVDAWQRAGGGLACWYRLAGKREANTFFNLIDIETDGTYTRHPKTNIIGVSL